MGIAIKRRLWALGCALSLLLCVPLVKPWLQMGTVDDTSYARSAQLLAQTGHIVYNGWAAPILGWHLYWGALFIKLFGFSFNVLRFSTLIIAMSAAFVSQRALVRSGLTEQNATLGTLTLVLSPLYLPLTFSYMTDVGGYFVLVLCFYSCLRALQAETDANSSWWIAFATATNAIGGTIRQTSWLGLLVIIPPTLWLLRRRKMVFLCGVASLVLGLCFMAGVMEWYKHQPRIMAEPVWRGPLTMDKVRITLRAITRTLFDAPLFALPVLLPFFPKLQWANRRAWIVIPAGAVALGAFLLLLQHQPAVWLEPTAGNYFTERGVLTGTAVHGWRPLILPDSVRFVLSVLVIGGLSAVAYVLIRRPPLTGQRSTQLLPWSSLLMLAVPFAAVYIVLMMSRAGVNMVFDRYLLPLLFFLILVLARVYQERISRRFPRYAFALLAIVAICSAGLTHDAFSNLRARLQAAQELEAHGVPDSEIDGGWEFNTWVALQRYGFLLPYEGEGTAPPLPKDPTAPPCTPAFAASIPGLHAKYALSENPNSCGGQVGLPPVVYHSWLGPRNLGIYIVSPTRQGAKLEAIKN